VTMETVVGCRGGGTSIQWPQRVAVYFYGGIRNCKKAKRGL